MRTTKPISTISYNSPEFLLQKCDELMKAGVLSFWCFIHHKAEEDEKKDHFHVYFEPSKLVQTDDIRAYFKELDPSNDITKPLGCIQFVSSKFADFYLYCMHDRRYLASKGQSRQFHYSTDDFVVSDEDDFEFKIKSIDLLELGIYSDMQDAIDHGVRWEEYFARGTIPVPQIRNFREAWFTLLKLHTSRNGAQNHSEDPNGDTVQSKNNGSDGHNWVEVSNDEELPF